MNRLFKNKLFGIILISACFAIIIVYITMPNETKIKEAEVDKSNADTRNLSVLEENPVAEVKAVNSLKGAKHIKGEENNKARVAEGINDNSADIPTSKVDRSGVDLESNLNALEARYSYEERVEPWSGYWESELETIVLFAGAQAPVKETSVNCKSSVCQVSVSFLNKGPNDTVMAINSLSNQFLENDLQFSPSSIDPSTGEVIFYTKPGEIK